MTIGKALSVSMSGLSEVEAQTRLQSEGHNELPRQDRRTPLRIVLEVFREPMFALLLGGGFIYLLLGDLKEALILLGFEIMSVAITVIQETRTERVLEALRDLTSPRALVIRDGVRRRHRRPRGGARRSRHARRRRPRSRRRRGGADPHLAGR